MGISGRTTTANRSFCVVAFSVLFCSPVLAAEVVEYEYDALGRLDAVIKDDGTVIDYEYDAAGNRKSREVSSGGSSGGPPPNSPPTAVDDSVSIARRIGVKVVDVVANDTDPDGDALTVTAVTSPWNAHVQIRSDGQLTITAEQHGTGTFTYTVSDGNGGTDSGTVTVTTFGIDRGDRR